MSDEYRFAYVDPNLAQVLDELRPREPIFHTLEFARTPSELAAAMAPHYWEVGATGRRYSREFILRHLTEKPGKDAASAGWETHGFGIRRLGPETYLLTYTLRQGERVTRRATIWENASGCWRALYHQGTLVSVEGDDLPSN